jgi:lysophospholipase L1-like esterase
MTLIGEVDDPHCLRPGEAEALLADAPWSQLLVLGDSIAVHPGDPVHGYLGYTWTQRLAGALRPDDYLNLGVAGARVAEVRAGQLSRALRFRPDLAVLVAGANDAVSRSYRPDVVGAELETMVSALTRAGALVVTMGCFDAGRTAPVPPEHRAGLSGRLRTLARDTGQIVRRYGGVHVDFADHPAQAAGVLGADLLHINARGHAVVTADLVRALARRVAPSAVGSADG